MAGYKKTDVFPLSEIAKQCRINYATLTYAADHGFLTVVEDPTGTKVTTDEAFDIYQKRPSGKVKGREYDAKHPQPKKKDMLAQVRALFEEYVGDDEVPEPRAKRSPKKETYKEPLPREKAQEPEAPQARRTKEIYREPEKLEEPEEPKPAQKPQEYKTAADYGERNILTLEEAAQEYGISTETIRIEVLSSDGNLTAVKHPLTGETVTTRGAMEIYVGRRGERRSLRNLYDMQNPQPNGREMLDYIRAILDGGNPVDPATEPVPTDIRHSNAGKKNEPVQAKLNFRGKQPEIPKQRAEKPYATDVGERKAQKPEQSLGGNVITLTDASREFNIGITELYNAASTSCLTLTCVRHPKTGQKVTTRGAMKIYAERRKYEQGQNGPRRIFDSKNPQPAEDEVLEYVSQISKGKKLPDPARKPVPLDEKDINSFGNTEEKETGRDFVEEPAEDIKMENVPDTDEVGVGGVPALRSGNSLQAIPDEVLVLTEVAKRYGLAPSTVKAASCTGLLRTIKYPGVGLLTTDIAVRSYLNKRYGKPGEQPTEEEMRAYIERHMPAASEPKPGEIVPQNRRKLLRVSYLKIRQSALQSLNKMLGRYPESQRPGLCELLRLPLEKALFDSDDLDGEVIGLRAKGIIRTYGLGDESMEVFKAGMDLAKKCVATKTTKIIRPTLSALGMTSNKSEDIMYKGKVYYVRMSKGKLGGSRCVYILDYGGHILPVPPKDAQEILKYGKPRTKTGTKQIAGSSEKRRLGPAADRGNIIDMGSHLPAKQYPTVEYDGDIYQLARGELGERHILKNDVRVSTALEAEILADVDKKWHRSRSG